MTWIHYDNTGRFHAALAQDGNTYITWCGDYIPFCDVDRSEEHPRARCRRCTVLLSRPHKLPVELRHLLEYAEAAAGGGQ